MNRMKSTIVLLRSQTDLINFGPKGNKLILIKDSEGDFTTNAAEI